MKTIKLIIQISILALIMLLPLAARAQVNYAVDTNSGTAYVTNSPAASNNVVIASSYAGYPVTAIGSQAFVNNPNMTSVIIPGSVTNVGDCSFYDCNNLTNVTIGGGVISIGTAAFAYCSLQSLTIPDSVTSIGEGAFYDCQNVTNANGPIFGPMPVTIGSGVTSISAGAFALSGIANIPISGNVTNIGTSAFTHCLNINDITLPDGLLSIGNSAFQECLLVTNILIPDSVISIGSNAFANCNLPGYAPPLNISIGSGVTNLYGDTFTNYYIYYNYQNFFSFTTNSNGSLASVTFLGNAPVITDAGDGVTNLFAGCTNVAVNVAPGTTGWGAFAAAYGVVIAPIFNVATLGGWPVVFYPPATNTLQMSTNSAGPWATVNNAVALAALELTNPPAAGFFRLQAAGGSPPAPGLALYLGQPVLFYPPNGGYAPQMASNLAAPQWSAPAGGAFTAAQVTNAPPGAVFRLR